MFFNVNKNKKAAENSSFFVKGKTKMKKLTSLR
jgi:hypothetical protein